MAGGRPFGYRAHITQILFNFSLSLSLDDRRNEMVETKLLCGNYALGAISESGHAAFTAIQISQLGSIDL